jgi:peptide/nickel transport system permease protein
MAKNFILNKLIAFRAFISQDKRLFIGFTFFAIFLIIAFIISTFAPFTPTKWNTVPRDLPPSTTYLFGTTSQGRDVFWLLTWALQNSLVIGLLVGLIATFVGVIIGLFAGYKGGIVDSILTFFTDTFIVIPFLPLLILMSSLFQGRISILMLSLILCLFFWPSTSKQVRSMMLSLRERAFIETALFSGKGTFGIIYGEVLPLIAPWIFAGFTNAVIVAVSAEVALATIGVSSLETATLGTMIYWALQYHALLRGFWWWILTPVLTIILLFLSLFLISVGISSIFSMRET